MSWPQWLIKIAASFVSKADRDREFLLYKEEFTGPGLDPSPDQFHRGPLQLGDSGNISPGTKIVPAVGSTPQPANGLSLEIEGTQESKPVSVSLSISPFPFQGLSFLRIVATFATVPSIPPDVGPWAVGVGVREGGAQDTADDNHRISASMKVKSSTARLGAPQAPQSNPPRSLAPDRYSTLFPANAATGIEFTLELFLNFEDGIYSVSLVTPGGPVDTLPVGEIFPLPSLWPQTSLAVALVRNTPTGTGHVAMDLHAFAVYGIFPTRRRASSLLALARRALWRWVIAPSPLR